MSASPGAGLSVKKAEIEEFFWGENLMGVYDAPITISKQEKLVYSPHVFGPAISEKEYFNDHRYPNNLEEVWQRHFGFVKKETGQALIIGVYGIESLLHCFFVYSAIQAEDFVLQVLSVDRLNM